MKTTLDTLLFWRISLPHAIRQFRDSGKAAPRVASDSTLQLRKPTICPKCGGNDIRLILYGYPNAEALKMILRSEGCVGYRAMARWLPDWRCHG